MLSVYYPTREITRNRANVDKSEQMKLLTTYKENMLNRFKADEKETKRRRDGLKSKLAKGITFLDYDAQNEKSYDKYLEHVVYDLAGYMLHARRKLIGNCDGCWKSLLTNDQLKPDSFYGDKLVVLKSKGGLKSPTKNMFAVILEVEKILIKHFASADAYIRDSFDSVISKMSEMKVHRICCELHREKLASSLIYEYIVIRYRFQGKRKKQEEAAKADSVRHTQRKLSKISQQDKKSSKVVAQSDLNKKVAKNTLVKKDSKKKPVKNDGKRLHHNDPKEKEISQKIKKNVPLHVKAKSDIIEIVPALRISARKKTPKLTKAQQAEREV